MSQNDKKRTAPNSSTAIDVEQSPNNTTIIPRTETDFNGDFQTLEAQIAQFQLMSKPNYLHTTTLNELYQTAYPCHPPIIEGLLYPGTYIFAGAPKIGKSFLVAQIAYHVSMGLPFWGRPVEQCSVLYLALEDPYQRLQQRLSTMFDVEGTDNLRFAIAAKQVGLGLTEQLTTFLEHHPATRLIIIDTLKKIRASGGEKYSYDKDYELVEQLKAITDKLGICILIVHHTRKQESTDALEKVSGTMGLTGAADCTMTMYKPKRVEGNAILEISGRDQPDQKFVLRRDIERLTWDLESTEAEVFLERPEPLLDAIDRFLTTEQPEWSGTATELVTALDADIKPNKLTMKLNVHCARLQHTYGIHYDSSRTATGRHIHLRRDGHDDK